MYNNLNQLEKNLSLL